MSNERCEQKPEKPIYMEEVLRSIAILQWIETITIARFDGSVFQLEITYLDIEDNIELKQVKARQALAGKRQLVGGEVI